MSEVGAALVVVLAVVGAVCGAVVSVRRNHLVATGQAKYLVKIAASGKGKTYHSPGCNRCRGGVLLSLEEARAKFYAPCASCGGTPGFRRILR